MSKVFLFEYATCTAEGLLPSIAVEGMGMFKALYEGFALARPQVYRTTFGIENPISFYGAKNYPMLFEEYLDKAEFVLAIAPESDFELYKLTKKIESSSCKNLGCGSKSIEIATDKFLTYKKLKGINIPKTEIFDGKTRLEFPLIAKPRDGAGCEGVFFVESEGELEKIPRENYIIQEYAKGQPCSASLLVGDEINLLSLQTQEIENFKYLGAKIPIEIENTENILRAVEKIKLHGFVGVDFIASGDIKIIEINPRPTTPITALNKVFDFNIAELILKNYYREKLPKFEPKRKIYMKKIWGNKGYVSFGGYSLVLEEETVSSTRLRGVVRAVDCHRSEPERVIAKRRRG